MSQCSWLVLKKEIKVRFSGLDVLVHTVFFLFCLHNTEQNSIFQASDKRTHLSLLCSFINPWVHSKGAIWKKKKMLTDYTFKSLFSGLNSSFTDVLVTQMDPSIQITNRVKLISVVFWEAISYIYNSKVSVHFNAWSAYLVYFSFLVLFSFSQNNPPNFWELGQSIAENGCHNTLHSIRLTKWL